MLVEAGRYDEIHKKVRPVAQAAQAFLERYGDLLESAAREGLTDLLSGLLEDDAPPRPREFTQADLVLQGQLRESLKEHWTLRPSVTLISGAPFWAGDDLAKAKAGLTALQERARGIAPVIFVDQLGKISGGQSKTVTDILHHLVLTIIYGSTFSTKDIGDESKRLAADKNIQDILQTAAKSVTDDKLGQLSSASVYHLRIAGVRVVDNGGQLAIDFVEGNDKSKYNTYEYHSESI